MRILLSLGIAYNKSNWEKYLEHLMVYNKTIQIVTHSDVNIGLQIQQGLRGSSWNYCSRGVGWLGLPPDAKRREVVPVSPSGAVSQHRGLFEIEVVLIGNAAELH